jgi:hypothetical protein
VNTSEVNTSEVNTSEVNTSEVNASEVNASGTVTGLGIRQEDATPQLCSNISAEADRLRSTMRTPVSSIQESLQYFKFA